MAQVEFAEFKKLLIFAENQKLKKMFEEIAKEMTTKTGHNISAANCENRWKHLERTYKKYVDNNNKTGRGRRDFEYADIMDQILGKKKNINPVILLSTETVQHPTDVSEPEKITKEESLPVIKATERKADVSIKTKERYSSRRTQIDILKSMREDRKEYYKKRLEQEEKRLDILEKYLRRDVLDVTDL